MRLVATLALVVASLVAPGALAQSKPTIAVLPLRVEGLQINEGNRINLQVRTRAASRGGFDVQSEGDTTQLVEASQSLGLDCDVNAVECGVRVGEIADVAFVLLGRATGGLDGQVGIDATLVDVKQKTAVRRVSMLVASEPKPQAEDMNRFADVLFAKEGTPEAQLVSLALQVEPPGSDVIVDGVVRGVSPIGPVDTLAPGDHYVVVQKRGFLTYRSRLNVAKGEAAKLQVTLAVDPDALRTGPQGLEAAAPWIVTGVGGLAAIAGGVVAGVFGAQYLAYQDAVRAIEAVDAANQAELDDTELRIISENHDIAERNAQSWNGGGEAFYYAGLIGAGVGLVAGIGGAVWGLVQLGEADVEAPPSSPPPASAPAR